MKNVWKIVLTGGPCAGKTTAMNAVKKHFTAKGFRVLAVSETASDLICGGISPFNMDNVTFQYIVTSTMRFRESMMELAAQTVEEENVLIVCDRAQMDNVAYMTDEQYCELQKRMNTNIVEMRDGYDAVFHLETAAKGDKKSYEANFADNAARYETVQEAIETDNKILKSWVGQPHLRVIRSDVDFDRKIELLLREVSHVATTEPCETERKFLIKRPTAEQLRILPFARPVDIEQYYVKDGNESFRIRQRGEGGHYIYIRTDKKKKTDVTREEMETRLTREEYEAYKAKAECGLSKTRWCIAENGKYFELDMYPYSDELAIIEIELCDENEEFTLPSFVEVIKEVTDDERYTNHSIARTHYIEKQ